MTKWRKNPHDKFFIQFANCRFDKNELISCLDKIPAFYQINPDDEVIANLKGLIEDDLFLKCAIPRDAFINEWVRPDYESRLMHYDPSADSRREDPLNLHGLRSTDDYYKKMEAYFKQRGLSKNIWNNIIASLPFDYIRGIGTIYYELNDILRKITGNEELEQMLLDDLEKGHNSFHIDYKIRLGGRAYLDKANGKPSTSDSIPVRFLWALTFYDLAEFLSGSEWNRLRKCSGVCGGKYFIRFGKRKYHSEECSDATEYKKDQESGKRNIRAQKLRDSKKQENENKKRELRKELRKAAERSK